jgi:hypothetical protein
VTTPVTSFNGTSAVAAAIETSAARLLLPTPEP